MNFVFWAARKLRINGGDRANTIGNVIAVTGVALAIIIMEATLAVTSGFKEQITRRVKGFQPEVAVLPAYDFTTGVSAPTLSLTPALQEAIEQEAPGASASRLFTQPAILKTDSAYAGVYLQAYDSEHNSEFEKESIVQGAYPDLANPDSANCIIISQDIARSLKLAIGNRVNAYFFVDGAIKARRLSIAAIYNTGFSDYDQITVFAPLATVQKVAAADTASATQLALTLPPGSDIEITAGNLQSRLVNMYQRGEIAELHPVDNVMHTGATFFNWLSLLDTNVAVIFILMSCVAGFTLISSMFILALDRIPTIGLLRALGATKMQIRGIFTTLAMKTVLLGMAIGNVAGLALLLAQKHYHFLALDSEMYYLPYVPINIVPSWIVILNIAVLCVAWALLLIPARVAASVSPARTIRYE